VGLNERRTWRNRLAMLAAIAVAVFATSWVSRPVDAALSGLSTRIVRSVARIEPIAVGEYFLVQASTCQLRAGFGCTAIVLPGNRGSVSRRPSIDPAEASSRRDARAEIRASLRTPSGWWRALIATPGAAYYTSRWVHGYGWESWIALAVSLLAASALVFYLFDASTAAWLVLPAGAATAWLLAMALPRLAAWTWELPLLAFLAVACLAVWRLRDLVEGSRAFERVAIWRRKRRLARGE
jgi:hypothetical protein